MSVRLTHLVSAALVAAVAATSAPAAEIRTVDLRGLEARSAALLLSGQEAGELEASFLARPQPSTGTGTPILLIADLAGERLLQGVTGSTMILEVYAYALDASGQPRATLSRAFRIGLAAHRALLESGGVKFLGRLDLPSGGAAESLRLLVLHRASGRFALRTLALTTAAETSAGATAARPPLILEPSVSWLLAQAPDESWPAEGGLPATRLVASAGGSLRLGLAAGDGDPDPTCRLLDGDGRPVAEIGSRVLLARPAPSRAREIVLDLSTTAPGSYLLEVTAGESGPATRLPLELVPEPLAEGTPWVGRRTAAEEDTAQVAEEPPVARRSDLARRALIAYHRAFEAWLGGDFDGAAAALRKFEAGAEYTGTSATLSIEAGQVRAASELVAGESEALVPLMCLHERLYRLYRASDSPQLATHSRRLAGEFARLYAERGGREAGRIAALVPVSLAGARQEIGARNAAQAAYERALELDPRQPEALLGLAALHESFAHYETTVELLRRLGKTGPLSPAARIRLAVNLGRVGSTRQAMAHLRELTEAAPEWVSRLAYQELARLLDGSKRGDEALAVLTEARERHPEDQKLIIQQAALLDRLGKPLAGQRALAALDGLEADPGDSARLRYSELPSAQITRARARLAQAAAERLPAVVEHSRAIQEAAIQEGAIQEAGAP
jgi:tetratricopeptide (TPR) repeat protein